MGRRQAGATAALLVTAAARASCRAVGTRAWAVLADVALDAEVDPQGRLVAATNVRRIATHLGISKDSAARALARLADAELLVRQGARYGTGGTFAPGLYELRLGPKAGVTVVSRGPGPAFRVRLARTRWRSRQHAAPPWKPSEATALCPHPVRAAARLVSTSDRCSIWPARARGAGEPHRIACGQAGGPTCG